MRDALVNLLQTLPDCSFVDICNRIPGARGELSLVSERFPTVVLWVGLSAELVEALKTLQRDGQIEYRPCLHLSYLVDGQTVALPLAKRFHAYKRPHWLPVHVHLRENGAAKRA